MMDRTDEDRAEPEECSEEPLLLRVQDLLSPDDQERLQADLADIARKRRQAWAAAWNWPMP